MDIYLGPITICRQKASVVCFLKWRFIVKLTKLIRKPLLVAQFSFVFRFYAFEVKVTQYVCS